MWGGNDLLIEVGEKCLFNTLSIELLNKKDRFLSGLKVTFFWEGLLTRCSESEMN